MNRMLSGSKLLGWFKQKNDLSLDRMKQLVLLQL